MGLWDRGTVRRWTVRRCGGGTRLELAGGDTCAMVVVLVCMVVVLLPGIAGLFGAEFRTDLVPGRFSTANVLTLKSNQKPEHPRPATPRASGAAPTFGVRLQPIYGLLSAVRSLRFYRLMAS